MADALRLILASASAARKTMLAAAGLTFDSVPARIDEAAIKAEMLRDTLNVQPGDVAARLAAEKAIAVSAQFPDALVIGSDQVLALRNRIFSKAVTRTDARSVLEQLRGRTHELVSGAALAQGGAIVWETIDSAELVMRKFSDEFLTKYLDQAGARILGSVGCYELEGFGLQLFESVEGDYFTILGMPLLALLSELRNRGVVMT
jgi:septum formation protein